MEPKRTNNKSGFWSVILISCIPVLVGSIATGIMSKQAMIAEVKTNVAVMNEKINGNKELVLNLLAESEKRRTEQYQYICNETQEIKEQLKQKKDISMLMLGDSMYIYPEMEFAVKRCPYNSRWIDTLHYYTMVNDSLYLLLCLNLKEISAKIPTTIGFN